MSKAVGMSCTLAGDCTWPRCIGPNGCMRDRPTPVATAVKATSLLPVWSPRNKPVKVKPKPRPVMVKAEDKPSRHRDKDRKSVSVSRTTYDQMKKVSMAMNVSMAGILEDECNRFFSKKDDE